MYDKQPKSTTIEERIDENIGELTVCQMEDIVTSPEYNLVPLDASYSEEDSVKLSAWVREHDGELKDILAELGYHESDGELTEANMKRLKLCLMTPAFIYQQDRKDRNGDKSIIEDLSAYDEALREMIMAHPGITEKEVRKMLHGAVSWAHLPDTYRVTSSRMIESAISGARGELIMKQLVESSTAKAAGIVFEDTSIEYDQTGCDCRLIVPITKQSETVPVNMGVDLKSDHHQILDLLGADEEIKPWVIRRGRLVLWPGITRNDLNVNSPIMLDEKSAEERGAKITPILREAAEAFHGYESQRNIRRLMGRSSLRSA